MVNTEANPPESQIDSQKSFRRVVAELANTAKAANALVPGCVMASMLVAFVVVSVSMLSVNIMMGVTILIVLASSVIVYSGTDNYGEAALALAAGLLAVFSIDWSIGKFLAFFASWVGFSLTAMLIWSVKIGSKSEEVYFDAASTLHAQNIKATEKQLREIANSESIKMLGPIERAEVIRLFAFRKIPLDSMEDALRAVDLLYTITRVSYNAVANFVADVYRVFGSTPGVRYQRLLNQLYEYIRESPVSPEEFFAAFRTSRHVVLSGETEPETYFERLIEALGKGIPSEELSDYLRDDHQKR